MAKVKKPVPVTTNTTTNLNAGKKGVMKKGGMVGKKKC